MALTVVCHRAWPRIPLAHRRAAQAILRCHTVEAGLVFYRWIDYRRIDASPVSCGHRACSPCGQHKAAEWEARQKARLLPVPYQMVTFTIPCEFRVLSRASNSWGPFVKARSRWPTWQHGRAIYAIIRTSTILCLPRAH